MSALAAFGPAIAQAQTTETYQVHVFTSDIAGAGTDAEVNITFYGTRSPRGVKAPVPLDNSGNDFEQQTMGIYQVSLTEDIGFLERIKLEHDNSGPRPGWHVDAVHVFDPVHSEFIVFPIKRWLADDEGDRLTEVTVERLDYDAFRANLPNRIETPRGTWERACSGAQSCESRIERSLTIGRSESEEWSNSVTASLSIAVESGVEAPLPKGGSLSNKTTVTAGLETGHVEASSIVRTRQNGFTDVCATKTDTTQYNIHTVWQWVVTTSVEGEPVVIKTCQIACTATDARPFYLPGDPRHVNSCLVSREFRQVLNAGIPGHNRETLDSVSLATCQQECRNRPWCKTVDYERGPGTCFLQDVGQNEVALRRDYPDNPYDHYYLPSR
ncbi:hypothetical protein AVJ23_08490 [Pseudoponticoccus marisrubri]|uniref:Apple domain-containing protein n=1 Tax=Pseudoponticoccus marisrubri TaxID=1685382 RepID=A0A0W7WKJ9_9RHOB|nr:hypothetical protein AVJ23_08490 [Pseudoponticoccus marisrubri]